MNLIYLSIYFTIAVYILVEELNTRFVPFGNSCVNFDSDGIRNTRRITINNISFLYCIKKSIIFIP